MTNSLGKLAFYTNKDPARRSARKRITEVSRLTDNNFPFLDKQSTTGLKIIKRRLSMIKINLPLKLSIIWLIKSLTVSKGKMEIL